MPKADSHDITNPSIPTGFLSAVARIHISHLFQDPFLRAAFKAAEDDGLVPAFVETVYPRHLDGDAVVYAELEDVNAQS